MSPRDIHEQTYDEIQRLIDAMSPHGDTEDEEPEGLDQSESAKLSELRHDKALLQEHWRAGTVTQPALQPDGRVAPTYSRSCGNPQPCPHALGLASMNRPGMSGDCLKR